MNIEVTSGYLARSGVFKLNANTHFELALKYFEEGRGLVDRDPVQSCEKLYKATEEAIKGLVIHFNIKDIIESIERTGEWSEREFVRAVERLSRILGEWIISSWDTAWALRTLCYQEAKFNSRDVKTRIPSIETLISVSQNISQTVPASFIVEYVDKMFRDFSEKMKAVIREEIEKLRESVDKSFIELTQRVSSVSSEVEKSSREVKSIKTGLRSRLNFILWLLGLRKRLFSEERH